MLTTACFDVMPSRYAHRCDSVSNHNLDSAAPTLHAGRPCSQRGAPHICHMNLTPITPSCVGEGICRCRSHSNALLWACASCAVKANQPQPISAALQASKKGCHGMFGRFQLPQPLHNIELKLPCAFATYGCLTWQRKLSDVAMAPYRSNLSRQHTEAQQAAYS